MSFVTSVRLVSTLSTLLILTTLVFACPGPDCLATDRARQAPVYITTTKPCHGAICHHEPTSPPQRPVITITSHRCATKSIIPYTSGSSTFWLSTPSCPLQPTVTSWMPRSGTCPLPVWGTATHLTTIISTIVQTSTEYSIAHASYPGPTVVSTLPGSTQVITYTRPGETLVFTPSASLQTITLTTDGATMTQTQAASSVTYTSIQAPSYYTVTTSIDALTLTTVLAAPTQVVTESLPGQTVVITRTLPAVTQYLTSVTSLPAYTTTITQAACVFVIV